MIYYLAHPYSDNPKLSQGFAENYTMELIQKGFTVFSPILHTHHFEMSMRRKHDNVKSKWDAPDYVAWDLKIIEGFMNHDGGKYITSQCIYFHEYHDNKCPGKGKTCCCCDKGEFIKIEKEKFDSGVIILLSNTAFSDEDCTLQEMLDAFKEQCFDGTSPEWKDFWNSQGCCQEYEFAKSHHIRILELESFLEGKEVEL